MNLATKWNDDVIDVIASLGHTVPFEATVSQVAASSLGNVVPSEATAARSLHQVLETWFHPRHRWHQPQEFRTVADNPFASIKSLDFRKATDSHRWHQASGISKGYRQPSLASSLGNSERQQTAHSLALESRLAFPHQTLAADGIETRVSTSDSSCIWNRDSRFHIRL
jgi:hypothetical protein